VQMRRIALLVVAVGLTASCGASQQVTGSHSAAHRYSVAQVERAFADQGIVLRHVTGTVGWVVLSYRHPARYVHVAVGTGRPSAATIVVGPLRVARRGNVMASSDAADTRAVRAAG